MPGILIDGEVKVRFATPMQVISNQPIFGSDSISLKRYTHSYGVQRWEIKTAVEPSNFGYEFFAHSVINGYSEIFDIRMPQVFRGEGNYSSAGWSASGSAGSYSVSASGPGTLKRGEFIRFAGTGGHNKVYMVTADCSGGTLNIFPRLRENVSGAIENGNNVTFKARYDTSTILGMTYQNGILGDPGTVTFLEAI
jgi:hypothetical protein